MPHDLWPHSHCQERLPTCPQPSLMRRPTHGLRDPSFPRFHGHRWPRPPGNGAEALRPSPWSGSPTASPTPPWSMGSRFSPTSFFRECRALGSWKKEPGERAKLCHQGASLRPGNGLGRGVSRKWPRGDWAYAGGTWADHSSQDRTGPLA